MRVLLRLENLQKSIGKQRILDIAGFDIFENTCMVLSGRNGAGKTTLLKIIAGLLPPDQLTVGYQGSSLPWKRARTRLRKDVIYLHQHPYMFDRSVADNIAYGLSRQGSSQNIRKQVDSAMEWAGIAHLAQKNAHHLSGGEKQRVALTRARVLSPKLLLMDEPFANMDLESREQTLYYIQRLKEDGISTIVTTHEPHVANHIGDEHRHLCKTGPYRFAVIEPFLYQRDKERQDALSGKPARIVQAKLGGAFEQAQITAVILAGGKNQRMGGKDKGLMTFNGHPLIETIAQKLQSQTGYLMINAARRQTAYAEFGYPLVEDISGDFFGPLVGMASALAACQTPYLLTVPCDSPVLPEQLAARLYHALIEQKADIAVAHDGQRMQPIFALLKHSLLPELLNYLRKGGRKIDTWYAEHSYTVVDFSDQAHAFGNLNTLEEWRAFEATLKH
jgi:molybdenum cofactor guanylyltransferase